MGAAPPASALVLDRVTFTYPGAPAPVLDRHFAPDRAGETIALVGENGAGKTTLVKLMLGLYQPDTGRILLDGEDLATADPAAVRPRLSGVFQHFTRYPMTAEENVTLGNRDLEAGVPATLAVVGLGDLPGMLPDGLETVLAPDLGGVDLSGGQWQRLAIARAGIREASLVALDEPTASLDPLAEVAIFERFADLAAGRTTILVSHRLGMARLADRIVTLEHGRILETGSHDALLAQPGSRYAGDVGGAGQMVSVAMPDPDSHPRAHAGGTRFACLADIAKTQPLPLLGRVLFVLVASARAGVYIAVTGGIVDAFIASDGRKAFQWVLAFLATSLVEEVYWAFKPWSTAIIADQSSYRFQRRVMERSLAAPLVAFEHGPFIARLQRASDNIGERFSTMLMSLVDSLQVFGMGASIMVTAWLISPWIPLVIAIAAIPAMLVEWRVAQAVQQAMRAAPRMPISWRGSRTSCASATPAPSCACSGTALASSAAGSKRDRASTRTRSTPRPGASTPAW